MTQRCNGRIGLLTGVDKVFCQGANDTVAPSVYVGDIARVLAGCLDDTTGTSINDSCDAPGLGIEGILWHLCLFPRLRLS